MNTELQKCMNGELYDCHDPIFIERKVKAAAWCERYNSIPYSRRDERQRMLGELLGSVGTNVSIGTDFICAFSLTATASPSVATCSLLPAYRSTPLRILLTWKIG